MLALLPALHTLAVGGPEIGGQGHGAGVQQVAVFQGFVVLVVVGGQTQSTGFDPHIDVFRHQHHFPFRVFLAQCGHDTENLVVCLALGQAGGQAVVQRQGLEHELALGFALPGAVEFKALGNVRTGCACQGIERAAGLAGVACHLGHAFFVAIELFKHDHGQEDVVLFEPEQAHGIVHQHIGVQHKQLGGTGACALAAA